MSGRVRLGIAIAVLASLSMATPAASAKYEVHACRLPNGDPAPALGWKALAGSVASINCPGAADWPCASPQEQPPSEMNMAWSFQAPSGTTLAWM